MSEFKIEKGVPMPKPIAERRVYPWDEMDVGDSFLAREATVRGAAFEAAKKRGTKYTVRKVEGGYRCWRIA